MANANWRAGRPLRTNGRALVVWAAIAMPLAAGVFAGVRFPMVGTALVSTRPAVLALYAVLWGGSSLAQTRSVALRYSVEPGLESCPDERWVRQAVAARLGFDPFQSEAELQIDTRLRRAGTGLVGTLEARRGSEPPRKRDYFSPAGDCLELASAMELAIAIAVDPLYLSRPASPPSAVAQAPAPEVPPPPPPTPAVPPPTPDPPPEFRAGAGLHVAAGTSPSVTPGVRLEVAARWKRFSLGVEGRADLAGAVQMEGGSVRTSALLGSLAPCVSFGRYGACGLLSAGALQVSGEFAQARRETTPLLMVGLRGQADFPLTETVFLHPSLELQVVLTRITVLSGTQPVWVTPPVSGAAGLGVGVRFL